MIEQRLSTRQADAIGMSVSSAAWDGYDWPDILASMARLGIASVEMAFIKGYVNEFSDADLDVGLARELRGEMERHGQHCRVLSAHIDLGESMALESFAVRVRFAAELGARYLITNAASRRWQDVFDASLDEMAAIAREAGIRVWFENPGDGSDNLINSAADLPALLARMDRSSFGINYDPGNLMSHRPGLSPVDDALAAISCCDHLHLKAVSRESDGYHFGLMGSGDIDYRPVLAAIAERRLSFSLELPFRLRRDSSAQPWKIPETLPLEDIEQGVRASLRWVRDTHPVLQSS